MKKSLLFLLSAALLAGLFVGGCQKDDVLNDQAPLGVTNEEQAMSYYATNDEFVANEEETFNDKSPETFDYGTFGKVDAAITPIRWGRVITSVTRNVTTTIEPGDEFATALVEKTIIGTLKIVYLDGTTEKTIEKPFTDKSTRKVIFKRVDRDTRKFWRNWVPVGTSLINGGTLAPNNSVKITKLEFINPNGGKITVTDPNNYYLRYKWLRLFTGGQDDVPELIAGQEVKIVVTIESTSQEEDLVALRYGFGSGQKKRVRLTMTSSPTDPPVNNIYTRVYEISRTSPKFVHFHRGFFNMGVDVMTRGTLYDDVAVYAANWWGVPYRVF